MGQLVFQATAGGQVALVGPNPATNFSINVPAITGTLVTTGDTGTVTNTMLASNVYTAPGTIGSVTPNTGDFTTLSASSTVSGTGFSNYLASPPAIGGTTAAAGSFTNLAYTGTLTGGTGVVNLGSGQFYKDSSGNVGIGTSSPSFKLSLPSANNATYAYIGNLYIGRGSAFVANQSEIFTSGTDQLGMGTGGAAAYTFWTNSVERMRIDSSGNVLVGTTTANGKIYVIGLTNSVCARFEAAATTGALIQCINTNTSGSNTAIYFQQNGTAVGSITTSNTTTTYNITSDARLKENIVDASSGNIDDVKVRSFDWKSDGSHVEYGFIAQELVEVAPYAVHQPQDPEEMMAVDYSKLVPMMIKEIQDLKQRIKTLENK